MKCCTWIVALTLLGSSSVAAAEPPSAKRLLEAAIEAHGGVSALEDFPHLEMEGTVENPRRPGRRTPVVLRERSDGAYRREITFERRGRKFTPVTFYDGKVVKRRFRTTWDDLPTVEAEEGAAHRLPFLLGVSAADARVEGAGHEGDVDTWRVSVPDGRDRTVLHFAQEGGHVVALEYPGTSAGGMGTKEDVVRKHVYRDFRSVGDVLLPFDVETSEKGSPVSRARHESVRVLDAFDEEWIRVPDPSRRFIPSQELAF